MKTLSHLFFTFLSHITSDVKLAGNTTCSGRLEMLHNQTWMSVCDAAFDQQDAEVVCRELDCGAPVLGAAAFGKGDAQMWTQEIQCRGNESLIQLCSTSHDIQCSQENNVGLICSDFKTVRLVGGNSSCSGRVEVHHDGQWGTVCHRSWDKTDAEVVCRELGCGEALNAVYGAYFGQGSGPIWMDQVACSGSESTLKDCGSLGWASNNINCTHDNHVELMCSGPSSSDLTHTQVARLTTPKGKSAPNDGRHFQYLFCFYYTVADHKVFWMDVEAFKDGQKVLFSSSDPFRLPASMTEMKYDVFLAN
uniref:SRCR domain-containing protein n=1 Tax=Cyprinus carpio carpio TaxID=630221 RepID=A0A9J8CBV9_CYPCA